MEEEERGSNSRQESGRGRKGITIRAGWAPVHPSQESHTTKVITMTMTCMTGKGSLHGQTDASK